MPLQATRAGAGEKWTIRNPDNGEVVTRIFNDKEKFKKAARDLGSTKDEISVDAIRKAIEAKEAEEKEVAAKELAAASAKPAAFAVKVRDRLAGDDTAVEHSSEKPTD